MFSEDGEECSDFLFFKVGIVFFYELGNLGCGLLGDGGESLRFFFRFIRRLVFFGIGFEFFRMCMDG